MMANVVQVDDKLEDVQMTLGKKSRRGTSRECAQTVQGTIWLVIEACEQGVKSDWQSKKLSMPQKVGSVEQLALV
jgi:hypothetical protein